MENNRTCDLLNVLIDKMIEDAGMKPRIVIESLLELGFTPDELVELNFDHTDVSDLAAEYQVKIRAKLVEIARKVCTPGCVACFECGKSKTQFGTVPPIGTNTVCPLQCYGVEHASEKVDFLEELKNQPDLDDLYLLCKHCGHRDSSQDKPDSISVESCLRTHCLDCPVHMCREAIEECLAEGMSG